MKKLKYIGPGLLLLAVPPLGWMYLWALDLVARPTHADDLLGWGVALAFIGGVKTFVSMITMEFDR